MNGPRIAVPVLPGRRYDNYLNALAACGAEGKLVHEVCEATDFDALLLPGGVDVSPDRYGQEINGSEDMNPDLDALQLGVLEVFKAAGRPVLGICRGQQLINVGFGGTLIQNLSSSDRHAYDKDHEADRAHMSRAAEGSFLRELYGETFAVNSAHHQAVDAPGEGIEVVQWSDDGVAEAIVHRSLPVWGVQWHPERMCLEHRREDTVDGMRLFTWFIDQIRRT